MTIETRRKAEEIVSSLFHEDPIASALYADTVRHRTQLDPEKMLMLAVLEDAVFCLRKNLRATSRKGERLRHETEQWINEENGESLFSFDNICDVLGLDARYLRQGLMRWKQNLLRQPGTGAPGGAPKRSRKSHKRVKIGLAA